MNLGLDRTLIERMSEGVILLDRNAEVTAYNVAARGWLRECMALSGTLRALMARAANGLLALPTAVQLGTDRGPERCAPVDAWLCADGPEDYALFIAQQVPEDEFRESESRFIALLGEQARQEMAQLGRLLRTAQKPGELDRAVLARQCAGVDRLLVEIDQLSTLFGRDKVFLEERLSLVPLLKAVLPALPHQGGERALRYTLIETNDLLGALYGDEAWLKYAFRNLLSALGDSAPAFSEVVLDLRQLGDFIVLTGRLRNAPGVREERETRYERGADSALERDIRRQMCQRIVELHGGRLKILPASGDDDRCIESFTLNLLTGIPDHDRSRASCSGCRHILQSQAYARDLSALMAAP